MNGKKQKQSQPIDTSADDTPTNDTSSVDVPAANTMLPQPDRMTDKDVNTYMENLLNGKTTVSGLEKQALDLFLDISKQHDQSQKMVQYHKEQHALHEDATKRYKGQLDAYANLLIAAEQSRRVAK